MCNTRQKEPLPRAFTMAFGKRNFPVQPGHSYAVYVGFAEAFTKTLGKCQGFAFRHCHLAISWPCPYLFLPRAVSALGKVFAECPTENTRQRAVCCQILYRVMFVEGGSLQTLCHVLFGLCWVLTALGKAAESRSETWIRWSVLVRAAAGVLLRRPWSKRNPRPRSCSTAGAAPTAGRRWRKNRRMVVAPFGTPWPPPIHRRGRTLAFPTPSLVHAVWYFVSKRKLYPRVWLSYVVPLWQEITMDSLVKKRGFLSSSNSHMSWSTRLRQ